MMLWTLIKNLDTSEHDAIPNRWLISKERSWYPDKTRSSATKLAKEGAPIINEDDWIQIRIEIVKKDFDNFERCMKDAIRLDRNKRTLTASENEERGRGMRAKRSLYPSDVDETSSPRKSPRVLKEKPNTSYPRIPDKTPQKVATPTKSQTPSLSVGCSLSVLQKQNCPVKRKHICFLKQRPMSLQTMAAGLCKLSRSLTVLREEIHDGLDDVKSALAKLNNEPVQSKKDNAQHVADEENEDFSQILNLFPIGQIEDFNEFENKIKEDDFRKQIGPALLSISQSSNCSRVITSILRFVLKADLADKFSWKGMERGMGRKHAFSSTNFSQVLINTIRTRWAKEPKQKIEKTIASWLAQTQLKYRKMNKIVGENAAEVREEGGLLE